MEEVYLPQPDVRTLAVLKNISDQVKAREGDAYHAVDRYVNTGDFKDMNYTIRSHMFNTGVNFDQASQSYISSAPFSAKATGATYDADRIKTINRICNSVQLPFDVTVYRGMEDLLSIRKVGDSYKKTALSYYRSMLEPGEVFTLPSLMSTSLHPDTSAGFAAKYKSARLGDRGILLQIELPRGFHGLPIFSSFEGSEILLPYKVNGRPLRFVSLGKKTGMHYNEEEKEWQLLTVYRIKPIEYSLGFVFF